MHEYMYTRANRYVDVPIYVCIYVYMYICIYIYIYICMYIYIYIHVCVAHVHNSYMYICVTRVYVIMYMFVYLNIVYVFKYVLTLIADA